VRRMVQVRRLALVSLAALVLAACGGGGGETTPTTAAPGSTAAPAPGSTAPGDTTTTAAGPTTTAQKLGDCPVTALDNASGPVEITFWHGMNSANEAALKTITDAYNSSQQKVKVTLQNQTTYDDAFDKYRTASAGDRPELIQLPEYYLQIMSDSKTALPVQACVNASNYDLSDYVGRATSYWTIRSALQAMPFNISTPVLYYNRAAFTRAGLDPATPPKNLDELSTMAHQIKDKGAATFGIALDTGANSGGGWFVEQFFAMGDQLYADNGNGREAPATKVLFNNDFGAQSLGVLQKMVQDGSAVNVGENPQGNAQLFKMADAQQPAAMAIYSSAGLGAVLNLLKGGGVQGFTADDLGIGPFPGPAGDGSVIVGGAALWLVAGKSPEKTAAAWDYMKYLTSPDVQAQWAAATGYVPVRQSAATSGSLASLYQSDPRYKVALDQLLGGQITPASAGPVLGPLRQVRAATAKAVADTFGGTDPKQALDGAASEANKQIEDYTKRLGG
jgi:sn-glycerol 3-phosphate transport system substrate-binding protein